MPTQPSARRPKPTVQPSHWGGVAWLFPILVMAAAVLPFAGALEAGFTNWDDPSNITENRAFQGFSREHLRWMWTNQNLGVYEPLSWMLKGAIFAASGLDPAGFHRVSLGLHAANALLVYLIARRLLRRAVSAASAGPAAVGALVAACAFAMHPLQAEVVVWASGQSYGLAAFFSLSAALAYVVTFDVAQVSTARRAVGLTLCTIAYACALLSKTAAMPLPAVLLLMDIYPLGRIGRRVEDASGGAELMAAGAPAGVARAAIDCVLEKLPMLGLAALCAIFAARIDAVSVIPPAAINLVNRILIAGHAVVFYPLKLIAPVWLSPFYPLSLPFESLPMRFAIGTVAAVVVTIVIVALARRWRGLAAAWFAYLLWLAPASGIVRHGDQYASDRYAYLSCIGFAILLGGVVTAYLQRRRGRSAAALIAVLAVALAGEAALGVGQTRLWSDSEKLWQHAVEINPDDWVAYNNLANRYLDMKQPDRALEIATPAVRRWPSYYDLLVTVGLCYDAKERPRDAIGWYERGLKIKPDGDCANNLAADYKTLGRMAEAIELLKRSAKRLPNDVRTLGNLATILTDAKRFEEAAEYLRHAVELSPRDAGLQMRLAIAAIGTRKFAEAEKALRRVLELNPNYQHVHYHLGYVLSEMKRPADAIQEYEASVAAEPSHVESRAELGTLYRAAGRDGAAAAQWSAALQLAPGNLAVANSLAWLLATSNDGSVRDGAEAVRLAEGDARVTGRRNARIMLTLAAALGEVGRFDEARQAVAEVTAGERTVDGPSAALIEEIDQRIRANQAIRGITQP